MTSTFLPDGYELPKPTGKYTKLQIGENKVRILTAAVIGWEYWNKENKSVRLHKYPKVAPADMRQEVGDRIKHFWAFKVWNYSSKQIEILELTQATIQGDIQNLSNAEEWGDPRQYDITISKSGSGLETKYAVRPSPAKAVSDDIKAALATDEVSLQDFFTHDEADEVAEVAEDDDFEITDTPADPKQFRPKVVVPKSIAEEDFEPKDIPFE